MPLYQSPYGGRIGATVGDLARLTLARGDAIASGILGRGQAWGRMAEQLGQIAGRTIGELADLHERRARLDYYQSLSDERRREGEIESQMSQAMKQWPKDPERAVAHLTTQGFGAAASTLQARLRKAQKEDLDFQIQQHTLGEKQLDQALRVNAAVRGAEDWPVARDSIRTMVGPDLAKYVPEEYDADRVREMSTWGMSMSERLTARRTALEDWQAGKDAVKSVAVWLKDADTPEEWASLRENAKLLGVPAAALRVFPEPWSKSAQRQAALIAGEEDGAFQSVEKLVHGKEAVVNFQPKTGRYYLPGQTTPLPADAVKPLPERARAEVPPAAGGFEDYLTRYARERQKPVSALSVDEIDAARTRWRKVEAKTPKGAEVSPAQKGDAERWKQKELLDLEKTYRLTTDTMKSAMMKIPLSADQMDERKLRIENSYREQIGLSPLSELPAAWRGVKPSTKAPTGAPDTEAVRERVRTLLRQQNLDDSDASIKIFLANPTNRRALGVR